MPGPAEVPTSYLIAAAPTVPQWVRILDELRTKSGHERACDGVQHLQAFLQTEMRTLTPQAFNELVLKLLGFLLMGITPVTKGTMVLKPEEVVVLGTLDALEQLLDVKLVVDTLPDKADKIMAILDQAFHSVNSVRIYDHAARILGHFLRVGGPLTADLADKQVRQAIHDMKADRQLLQAVLKLQYLAEDVCAIFNVHVREFIEHIWKGLQNEDVMVREHSVAALRACLVLVEARETRYRVQWYYKLFEETQKGLSKLPVNLQNIHGSLLALGELLRHTGEFMLARYKEVVETVLQFRESKDRHIRRAVVSLIPRLAAFAPRRFASTYLTISVNHLLSVLRILPERDEGFEALANVALALKSAECQHNLEPYLPLIAAHIQQAIVVPKKTRSLPSGEALHCAGCLATAMGPMWEPHVTPMVELMILTGLSRELIGALQATVKAIPSLTRDIQNRLLDLLCLALCGQPERSNLSARAREALADALKIGQPGNEVFQLKLALHTMGSFDFGQRQMLKIVDHCVLPYMDADRPVLRKVAALAAIQLVQRRLTFWNLQPGGIPAVTKVRTVEHIVHRLLSAACSDVEVGVRGAILEALQRSPALDPFLSQPDCMRPLFVTLTDEAAGIRGKAITLVGRLALINPAYVMPAMRKHLMQLLSDLENATDHNQREESAGLLGQLIRACPQLVLPYVAPILKSLLSKMRVAGGTGILIPLQPVPVLKQAASGESSVVATVLATTGELAKVAGPGLRRYMTELLPPIIEAIQDTALPSKSITAVTTLGQVVESTGLVVVPYMQYPQLLGVLLRILSEGSSLARLQVVKVLGIIGALDPHTHKMNQAKLSGEGKLEEEGVRPQRPDHLPAPHMAGLQLGTLGAIMGEGYVELLPASGMLSSSKDYYPSVAIAALMTALRNPAASAHQNEIFNAMFKILQTLGMDAEHYLKQVMPEVLRHLHRGTDHARRRLLLERLTFLAQQLREHMRRWLPDLIQLTVDFWDASALHITRALLALHTELAKALRDDMRAYLPILLPKYIALLGDGERSDNYVLVEPVLVTLESLGPVLEEHLPLLMPALVRLINPGPGGPPAGPRRSVLRTLGRLLPRMALAGSASAILHPLMRVLADTTHYKEELQHRGGEGHDRAPDRNRSLEKNKPLDRNRLVAESRESPEKRRPLEKPPQCLQVEALDTICALAVALGPDFTIFLPAIRKIVARQGLDHKVFNELVERLSDPEPPCMSQAEDWETCKASTDGLLEEFDNCTIPEASAPDPGHDEGGHVSAAAEATLRRAWESSQRSTKEDWDEWMRNFAVELLHHSSSPALRATWSLAQSHPAMARDLFPAAFVCCWGGLSGPMQSQLVRSLEAALASPSIPAEIVTTLLNLAEFMEHDEKSLPLDTRTLGALAEKCHAFAKALHYKELEFAVSPNTAVEALISINNQLRQPEAARGILIHARSVLDMELKESWYEKLGRWEEALEAYDKKLRSLHNNRKSAAYVQALLGRLRCLAALAQWESLSDLCAAEWRRQEAMVRRDMAAIAAHAAWHMGDWDSMAVYTGTLKEAADAPAARLSAEFLSGVLHAHNQDWAAVAGCVKESRELLGRELAALVSESYERAYLDVVRAEQLAELEEVVAYSQALSLSNGDAQAAEAKRNLLKQIWRGRLKGVQRNVEVWQALLSVRTLVLPMQQDLHTWLKFASLCRKSNRAQQGKATLLQLLRFDPARRRPGEAGYGAGSGAPEVMLGYLKHLWYTGADRVDVLNRLEDLRKELGPLPKENKEEAKTETTVHKGPKLMMEAANMVPPGQVAGYSAPFAARVHLRAASWRWQIVGAMPDLSPEVEEEHIESVHEAYRHATTLAPTWGKAWHQYALFNVTSMEYYSRAGDWLQATHYVAPAVKAFFSSIAIGQSSGYARGNNLQDILRLLTLWFSHGQTHDVQEALKDGFKNVSVDTWLVVLPQIIARIHTTNKEIRELIHHLLTRVGRVHPQALIYPLLVACKSSSAARKAAAQQVLSNLYTTCPVLVEQAQLVSQELIRMAILWHEMWHEALEEASRQYFGENNVKAMLETLLPLHKMMEEGQPTTLKEIAFVQAYGNELEEAHAAIKKYLVSLKDSDLHQAWDLYYHVFKRINKQLPSLVQLELQYVAPALIRAQSLELAVPGTYIAGEPLVTIAAFAPQLHVISSKQRPRKLTIHGSDGAEYMFLLKGHEDLRQDERVMQLFGLVNNMLSADRITAERGLSIARYAVIPLSPNSGLIGWVPNCDTLHTLIRDYRESRKVPLNVEHRLMLGMAPDYDQLSVIQKVEVFEHALDSTSGDDLHRVLWLKSRSSEVWLERRTFYTRSTAVMSMVGYLLGLGDRHPSNLMLDRYSGKLLHIDFGDCFEASMHREKFPEKVPFRLTRMMIMAMGVSGIEGNFRFTCEHVMRVLRANKDSVMAMLEAFVHDPLINWRLLHTTDADAPEHGTESNPTTPHHEVSMIDNLEGGDQHSFGGPEVPHLPARGQREQETLQNIQNMEGNPSEVLNERAVAVMQRMSDKLTGRDFVQDNQQQESQQQRDSGVESQVNRLIQQATSHENLCQSYIGWCPFW